MTIALSFDRRLADLNASYDLIAWSREYRDMPSAWAACERGDWLLWLAAVCARTADERRATVAAAAACARLALPHLASGQPGPLAAIKAAESWSEGGAPADVVRAAADGAAYSTMLMQQSKRSWAASSAAWAVAWAAVWLDRPDDGTMAGAQAVRHAAEATAEAADAGRELEVLAHCARLVRDRVPVPTLPN